MMGPSNFRDIILNISQAIGFLRIFYVPCKFFSSTYKWRNRTFHYIAKVMQYYDQLQRNSNKYTAATFY